LKKSNIKNAIQKWGKYDVLHMMYLVGTKQNNDYLHSFISTYKRWVLATSNYIMGKIKFTTRKHGTFLLANIILNYSI
jgi:hypothetical protein